MSFSLARARRREASRQARDQYRQETGEHIRQEQQRPHPQETREYQNGQKEAEEEIRRQEREAVDRLNRQKVDMEADLLRKAEDLRHREEALRQEQARREQMNRQEATQKAELDPAKLQDAYCILGVAPSSNLADYRKAWVVLVQQYHPDKTAHLGEELRKLAHVKTQELNRALETIKKSF